MKKIIIKSGIFSALALLLSGCGNSFLDTPMYNAVDIDGGLTDIKTVGYALNGTYSYLLQYQSAGNYSSLIGDYASDIVYNTLGMGSHGTEIYDYGYSDNYSFFASIWSYDYKVVDEASRVIQACGNLIPDANSQEKATLQRYEAEARALRAYANLMLVNVFGHQVKVAGQDFSGELGIVLVETPVQAYEHVERSTVGETYSFILNDLNMALSLFEESDDSNEYFYFSPQSVYGLLARTYLYLEDWTNALSAAQKAIQESGITTLTYNYDDYKALYDGGNSNDECLFALSVSNTQNNGTNSAGNFFNGYGWSVSPYLYYLYAPTDCRLSIYGFEDEDDWWGEKNKFNGGKFGDFGGASVTYACNYLVNAPEMYLIAAEASAQLDQLSSALDYLLVVAKRNNAITNVNQLPSTKQGFFDFLYEERARELFQEGLRLWDLRRWNIPCNLYAYGAPEVDFYFTNQVIGNLVFPIPSNEINAGFGVTQNSTWSSSKPQ